MYKNIIYILSLLLLFSAAGASAQQLEGKWRIDKVELEKRDFWNNSVLKTWSVSGDSLRSLKVAVQSSFSFSDTTCVVAYRNSIETWTYSKISDEFFLKSRSDLKDGLPLTQIGFAYKFEGANYLWVGPVTVSYTDKSTGEPTKISYRCRYELSK